jgi:hypothetical protein
MKVLMFHVLGDFAKDIVVQQLFLVATQELLVKRKSTALIAVNLEVPHLLTSFIELLGVLNADHCGAEWFGKISSDLRLGI